VVSGGQTSTGLTLILGDTLTVLSGGLASASVIDAEGSATISADGLGRGAGLLGGSQTVLGTASTTTVFAGIIAELPSGFASAGTIGNGERRN
jgi:autotransporter passenger strand-loop-strand repeat protein